jgi:hypothetical protein
MSEAPALASDEGGESGGLPVRVQWTLGAMTGGPLRRLQELAAGLCGRRPRSRATKEANPAGCRQSAMDFRRYDGRAAAPTAGARGWVMWEAPAVASDEGGESGGLPVRVQLDLQRNGSVRV